MIKTGIKNFVLPKIASFFRIETLIEKTHQPLIHVFYHAVSDDYLPHINPIYRPKTSAEFVEDIDFLLRHFRPVDIYDVLRHANGEKIIDFPAFHLSFDDGLESVYRVAAPVLTQKGVPATIFVNSAFVDNAALFYRYKAALLIDRLQAGAGEETLRQIDEKLAAAGLEKSSLQKRLLQVKYLQRAVLDEVAGLLSVDFEDFLEKEKPYLTINQLRELQEKGFSVGAHGVDHPHYSELSTAEQIAQTVDSCDFVSRQFGEKNRFFVFPFGDEGGRRAFDDVFQEVDLVLGIAGIKNEFSGRYRHRIDMEIPSMKPRQRIGKAYLTHWLKNLR